MRVKELNEERRQNLKQSKALKKHKYVKQILEGYLSKESMVGTLSLESRGDTVYGLVGAAVVILHALRFCQKILD